MKLRVPSPALVISIIALVVACTATAYAATKVTSSGQIKNNIIKSADIKNKTITNKDIKKSTILATNLSKSTLRRIDSGGSTSTDKADTATALEITREGPKNVAPANKNFKVIELTVPKGAYIINGKIIQRALPISTAILQPTVPLVLGNCKLDAGGDIDDSVEVIGIDSKAAAGNHSLQITRTFAGESTIALKCDSTRTWSASFVSLIAHRVGGGVNKTDIPE